MTNLKMLKFNQSLQ